MKKYITTLILLIAFKFSLIAQNNTNFENALVGTNKMIAVIAVLVVILLGITFFLFYLERKLNKLEKNTKLNK